MDEALARSTDQKRQIETAPLMKPGDTGKALLWRLAEADAGIEHDPIASDARLPGDFERAREELRNVGDDIDRGVGGVAIVHDDDGGAVFGDNARHVGIALEAPNVVDDGGSGFKRPGGHGSFDRVDRNRNADRGDSRQDRFKPLALFLERNRASTAVWPGRFRPDVDDVGALGAEAPGLF